MSRILFMKPRTNLGKGLLVFVEKRRNGTLRILKEEFSLRAEDLMKQYLETRLLRNQAVCLIGENREKFMSRGFEIPRDIRTANQI